MVALKREQLRSIVGQRSLEAADAGSTRMRLELLHALPRNVVEALHEEAALNRAHAIEGVVAPRSFEVQGDALILELDPIHPGAVRLQDLVRGLALQDTRLGDGLAAAIAATAAQLCHKIHLAPSRGGVSRIHRSCHPETIILTPMGTVALLGCGLPGLDGLLVPHAPLLEAQQTSPEVARGGPDDLRSDVYRLGALYFALLTGHDPWPAHMAPGEILTALYRGQLPELPQDLPDPRPTLVELLRRAMAPHTAERFATALAFGQGISRELKASGRPRADAKTLERMLAEMIPKDAPRGAQVLGVTPPSMRAIQVPKDTPTKPAPPSHEQYVQATRSDPSSNRGWSQILGDTNPAGVPKPVLAPVDGAPAEPLPKPARKSLRLPPVTPASTGPTKSALPLPDPASGPTVASAPAPGPADAKGNPLAAFYDGPAADPTGKDASPRWTPRPTADPGDRASMKRTLVGGAAVLVVIFAVWGVVKATSTPAAESTPDAAQIAGVLTLDAGQPASVAALPDVGFAMKPAPTRDAGPVLKPLGFLTVISEPTGATVELDGGYVGKTPLVLKHDFEDRIYEVAVMAEGHLRWEKSVRPTPNKKTLYIKAVLEKNR